MTTATKLQEFERLMNALRTEWFVYQDDTRNPKNINQVNTLCNQIINLNLNQEQVDEQK